MRPSRDCAGAGGDAPQWTRPSRRFAVKMGLLAMLLGSATLKVGDPAPDFTLPDTDGTPVTLSRLLASGPVIVAFFPKAFTPG